jgi:DNA-binding transcriptional LysR family regulator
MDLLEKMGTYVRVVEAGSLSAAAKQLRVSSAAVSRQITTLEDEVGVPLLLRTTRRMAMTPAGRTYYERCLRVLREVEVAQAVGRGDSLDGLLTVSASLTFGLSRVAPHVHALMKKHPGMRIDLRLDERVIDLIGEGVDVAIRVGMPPPESTGLVAHRLTTFRRVLVATPAYLKKRGEPKTPEAVAKHDALTHASERGPDGWTLQCDDREARVEPNVLFRSNALYAIRELALEGAGIALLPDWLVEDDVARGSLRVVLPGWEAGLVTVNALHRTEHRGAPRVRTFIEHLRRTYADRLARH